MRAKWRSNKLQLKSRGNNAAAFNKPKFKLFFCGSVPFRTFSFFGIYGRLKLGMLHHLFQYILVKEEITDADYNHKYAPELRRREAGDKTAAVVNAEEFDNEAPYAVSYAVNAEVAIELILEV